MPLLLYRTTGGGLHRRLRYTVPVRAAGPIGGGRGWRRLGTVAAAWTLVWAAGAWLPTGAQAPLGPPLPTFVGALMTYPSFFHARTVVLQGTLRKDGLDWWLESGADGRLRVTAVGAVPPDGRVEITGQFVDVGRVSRDDARLAGSGIPEAVSRAAPNAWPRPGEMLVVRATQLGPRPSVNRAGVRAVALDPARFAGERVRLQGQFRGRNLFADLPAAPARDRYEFVIRAAGAAVWVVGLRPKGHGVEMNLDSRADTSRWIEVSGLVRRAQGQVWIEGDRLTEIAAPRDARPPTPPTPVPLPAPEVIFSVPVQADDDVSVTTTVRIQFSRPMNPATFVGRVSVAYADGGPDAAGAAAPPFVADYLTSDRVLVLRFRQALAAYRAVVVTLQEGIEAADGTTVAPWTLAFSTGGRSPGSAALRAP